MQYNALQYNAMHCNALQYTAIQCNAAERKQCSIVGHCMGSIVWGGSRVIVWGGSPLAVPTVYAVGERSRACRVRAGLRAVAGVPRSRAGATDALGPGRAGGSEF